jgi:hypothetical protein
MVAEAGLGVRIWVGALVVGMALTASGVAQSGSTGGAAGGAVSGGARESGPVPAHGVGVTPPQLESGQTTVQVDKLLTQAQEDALLADAENIFQFASKMTGLPIEHPVKRVFISREEVSKQLRQKFDEDKGNKRMERSELVLKRFGLLEPDFELRPFLLSLLTEQIAGFYDNETKTMNLLNWVPEDEQKPVMAHELTHALQDQKVGLTKWEDPEPEGVAKDVKQDREHIATDEAGTAREAVLEGQAMVSYADYMLRDSGKTLKDVPQLGEQMSSGSTDMSDSPVLARAPLILQVSMLFPYTTGLAFEQKILIAKGTQAAFADVLARPPNSSFEVMHPEAYMKQVPVPVLVLPDIHPVLKEAGFEPYDVGVMGELDVRMTAELFGGRPLAEALAPEWDGGIYYAAQRKDATAAEKDTAASLGLMYLSRWKNEDSARSFMRVFEEELPRQYDGMKRQKKLETGEMERVYSTAQGDVLLSMDGDAVWVSEGFPLDVARKLREMVSGAQGKGPVMEASGAGSRGMTPSHELMRGWVGDFGVLKVGLR